MNTLASDLKNMAIEGMIYSYSPYSLKKIGASLLLSNGKTYSGCNIENASYGGTVCAERVAIWKAYSENLSSEKIIEIVVASNELEPWPPCGFCRQVMSEFCSPETVIKAINPQGKEISYLFKNLFPEAFKPSHLLK